MKTHHWVMLVVVLAIGYVVGAKYPQYLAKVPGLGS